MNQLNLNAILNREENVTFIKQTLAMFEQNKSKKVFTYMVNPEQ